MGIRCQLREVEDRLTKDLEETTVSFRRLGKKYGVSGQAISYFCQRKGIKRLTTEHTENCSICQSLIRIAKKPRSEFICAQTLKEKLRIQTKEWNYHIAVLRKKGLVSPRFGRLQSKRVELGYRLYFTKRLPVKTIGKRVGLKNMSSVIRQHKLSGWDVPAALFMYDSAYRRKMLLKKHKEKRTLGKDK